MSPRFQDTAEAYRTHRAVTNEAEVIANAVCEHAANDLRLVRNRLRVVDAGTGDGRVLRGIAEFLFQTHRERPCEMLLKEYDFQHIEALLQNMAPLLRRSPRLTLFVTNRAFRQLQGFVADLSVENTVCFDDVAGYRLLAMGGTAALLERSASLQFSFPPLEKRGSDEAAGAFLTPLSHLWNAEERLFMRNSRGGAEARALVALGDEIRAREIYDELAATGSRGKHFTVTIARSNGDSVAPPAANEFFWDLAIVSHAFNRDKDPGWVCRNILIPLCQGLSVGGVMVNVHAVDRGHLRELKQAVFGDQFPFNAPPEALSRALRSGLDSHRFELLPSRQVFYTAQITGSLFSCLEPWQRELALERMAISVAYHLQIPAEAWSPLGEAIEAEIQRLLKRDGQLEYMLCVTGVRRRE